MSDQLTLDVVDRAGDRAAVIDAIREAVRIHGNVISSNEIRPHIPADVFHKTIGQTYKDLIRCGALVDTDTTVRSTDERGGNRGKPIIVYRVHLDRLP